MEWKSVGNPPSRETCLRTRCELTFYCWNPDTGREYCAAFLRCPIAGMPKVTPANAQAFRLYNLCHSGLIRLDRETVPAITLDRLAVIDEAVSAEMAEETKRITGGG